MYEPIKYNNIPIGISYSESLGGYYVSNDTPEYYLADTEMFSTLINNQVIKSVPVKARWLEPKTIVRRLYGDSVYTELLPHHVQIVSNKYYSDTDIIGVKNKNLGFSIDNIEVNVLFASDATPAQIVTAVENYFELRNPQYRNALQFVNGRFTITTRTPKQNPTDPMHNFIVVGSGTANAILGFSEGDYALGDLPSDYDKFENFVLLYAKDETSPETQGSVFKYVPVIEKNNLTTVAMNEFYSEIISSNERLSAMFGGMAYGLDLVESEIDKIANLMDIDNIDENFLNQLANNMGFNLPALGNVTTDTKRDFIRNLMYLYKTKGNTDSFLSVFRYLYYSSDVVERNSDADLNYPRITRFVNNSDITEYYNLFVNDNMDENIEAYNWNYVHTVTGEMISATQWQNYQIINGLDCHVFDVADEITRPQIVTGFLEPFDVSSDFGILYMANEPSPAFSEGETLYVEATELGTVVSVISNTEYKIQYNQDALAKLPYGSTTGTNGGGGIIPGIVLAHEPNNKLVISVDDEYSVTIDFGNYKSVFLSGPRTATLQEVYTAIKIAVLEQNIPVNVVLSGTVIQFISKYYGSGSAVEIIQGNSELGLTTGQKDVNVQTPNTLIVSAGSVYIPVNGNYVECFLDHDISVVLDTGVNYILAELADSDNVYSLMIKTNKEIDSHNNNIALLAVVNWKSGRAKIVPASARDLYRVPYYTELNTVQYNQVETYVERRDNAAKFWQAAGTSIQHPWTEPDLSVYKDLGKSIFVDLVLGAFDSNRVITQDDITRILWFVEFLRPVYAVISTIIKVQSETETVIGLPMQLESLPEYETLGNYPVYYWDDTAFGVAVFDAMCFAWRNAKTNFQLISGFAPALVGGEFAVGDVLDPFDAVVTNVDVPGNSILVEDPTNSWNWPYAGTVTNQGSSITYTYTALSPYSLRTTPEVTTNPLPAAGATNYIGADGTVKTNPPWGVTGVDAIVNVPNRFSEYLYPNLWDKTGTGLPDILNGGLTQYDLAGSYPIWEISNEGSCRIDFDLQSATILTQAFVEPSIGYIEVSGYNFEAYKPGADIRSGNHEDIWPKGYVHIVDTDNNDFYGYVRWLNGYPAGSTLEPTNRMYIYQDIRGKHPGWGGSPLTTIKRLQIYKITLWDGGMADTFNVTGSFDDSDSVLTPPVDIFMDSIDSGINGLSFEYKDNLDAIGASDSLLNRTFGWNSASAEMYNIVKDADSIMVIKDVVDTTTVLLASTNFTYNATTGVIQYAAATDLSSVYVGSYFVDDLSGAPGTEKVHTIIGVDDANDQIQIRPNMDVNVFDGVNGVIYGTTLKKNSITDSLYQWNDLIGAFDVVSTYNQLTDVEILALINGGDIYYGNVDYEITRNYTVAGTSIVDNFGYGIFHLGMV